MYLYAYQHHSFEKHFDICINNNNNNNNNNNDNNDNNDKNNHKKLSLLQRYSLMIS